MKTKILVMGLTLAFCGSGFAKEYIFKNSPRPGVVAKFKGGEITEAELVKGIENELYEAEQKVYELKFNKLKATVLEKLISVNPKKGSMTNDEFLDQVIAKGVEASEKDINAFIKERGVPSEQVTPEFRLRVKNFLSMEQKRKAMDTWLSAQLAKAPVEVYLKAPERPQFQVTAGDSPFIGGKDAKVTIVGYSDFQCPHCERASKTIKDLQKKYGKKIKFVFKNFPMPFHQQAKVAAEATLCANEQNPDKFWKLHDEFFRDQSKLDITDIKSTAKKVGLDSKRFETCLDSHKYQAKIDQEMTEAEKIGIRATPTFFVNGKLVSGAQSADVFSEVIDKELSI